MKGSASTSLPLLALTILFCSQVNANDPQAVGNACAKMHPAGTTEEITDCIMRNLKSDNKVAVSDGQPILNQPKKLSTNKSASSGRGHGDKPILADENTINPTKGCSYLVVTKYGLTHSKGIKGCLGEKSMICEIKGKNSAGEFIYGWHVVSDNSCMSGYRDLKRIEQNSEIIYKASDNLKERGE